MASFISNLEFVNSDSLQESNRKKRRKIGDSNIRDQNSHTQIRWRSDTEQRIYSSKLSRALQHVLRRNPSSTNKFNGGREVRYTADRVLAASAKGKTRWSRAILSGPLRLKFESQHRKVKKGNGHSWLKKPEVRRERRQLPPLQKKVRVLGQLVPGCRKVSFPNLLEEATDYIAALEMQVRAMAALTELLSGRSPADPTRFDSAMNTSS
ncbi:Transcription factor [Quillaja saponaria]|uniref:Transcription factor n=1 Tax=Quillaja saponaria TaxID=32244 RepID=A0AAD7Q1W2_QUISA|nr:Transcription factor [Quillaja saponaria]KAJ7973258.1 Transcription factor [Quillaja saponaria]